MIIIDFCSTLTISRRCFQDIICGGRSNLVKKLVERFLTRLVIHGASLMFVCQSDTLPRNLDQFCTRQNRKYSRLLAFFDQLRNRVSHERLDRYIYEIPVRNFSRNGDIFQKYGRVIVTTTDAYADHVVANQAIQNNAMAVIGEHSDFLIFPGDWSYWSLKHVNFDEMSTIEYCRNELRAHLRLSVKQMFILATISGNKFWAVKDMLTFQHQTYDNIAEYVKTIRNLASLTDDEIQDIALTCMKKYTTEDVLNFKKSMDHYNIDGTPQPDKEIHLPHNFVQDEINLLLTLSPLPIGVGLCDLRRPMDDSIEMQSHAILVIPIFRRIAGVALLHKNDASLTIPVLTKWSHEESYATTDVYPDYPRSNYLEIN